MTESQKKTTTKNVLVKKPASETLTTSKSIEKEKKNKLQNKKFQ